MTKNEKRIEEAKGPFVRAADLMRKSVGSMNSEDLREHLDWVDATLTELKEILTIDPKAFYRDFKDSGKPPSPTTGASRRGEARRLYALLTLHQQKVSPLLAVPMVVNPGSPPTGGATSLASGPAKPK